MKKKTSAIQIIGTQRSGSNLLRLMINQFDEVSAPHPPHVLRTFVPLLKYYNDLSVKDNLDLLATDIVDFVNANPVSWGGNKLVAAKLVTETKHPSLLGLYEALYITKARQDNAKIWCCKSMFNEYYANEIEARGIKPFYIYMFRDGRDVAASFKKAIVGPKHVYHIANKWKEDQERAQEVKLLVGSERFFALKYEDLIAEPEQVLRNLSNKLGLSYTSKLLEYYDSTDSRRTASSGEMWINVAKPIIKNNVGKYQLELTADEIQIFENLAGNMLIELGYKLTTRQQTTVKKYALDKIKFFDEQNAIMQKEVRQHASKSELEHRSKQEKILEQIKLRLAIQ